MNTTSNFTIKIDWRLVSAVLALIILALVVLWQPWRQTASKTLTVRGTATVEQAPDIYKFQPYYQGADTASATAKGEAAVTKLKALGIKEADIKTNVSSYGGKPESASISSMPTDRMSATYGLQVTVRDKALAQSVASYLASSGASGQVTPQADFSDETRKKLDLAARRAASADAKTKAGVMAEQAGAKLGRVVKISEDAGFGIMPVEGMARDTASSSSQGGPSIQPGTNELSYSFTVVFELK